MVKLRSAPATSRRPTHWWGRTYEEDGDAVREEEVDEKPGGENWGSGQKCRALARFIGGKARPGGSSNIMQRSRRVAS